MHLYSFQHPAVFETLQRGERHICPCGLVCGERWQRAYRWMREQMAAHGIDTGEYAPV